MRSDEPTNSRTLWPATHFQLPNSGAVKTTSWADPPRGAAETTGVAPHLLRQWEDAGLLAPEREHGQRRYSDLDIRLVRFIQRGREVGMGLAELREAFAIRNVEERTAVLQRRKKLLEDRIAMAQRELAFVEQGLVCPHPDYRTCPELAKIIQQPISR